MKSIAPSARSFLVKTLVISNKEAIAILAAKRLLINGQAAQINQPVLATDLVLLDEKIIKEKETFIYLAYHKPRGIETTLNKNIGNNLTDALNFQERVFPAGRLDKDSEGLLLMTNDGGTCESIINSNEEQEKEYIVSVDKPLTEAVIHQLASGVKILGQVTRPAKVSMLDDYTFQIILTQGLNRQIRRMCRKIGYEVTSLKRTRIMHIVLGDLPAGKWRTLNEEEIYLLTGFNK